jgi:hypothetical protein
MYGLPDLAVTGDIIPAAWGNQVRDDIAASAVGLASAAGQLPYATGANALAMLNVGSAGQVLGVSGGLPAWGAVPFTGLPSVKRCRVYKSTAQAVTNGDPLTWDSETYDTAGWHESVTNPTRVTVDVTGLYLVRAQVILANAGGTYRSADLQKNASNIVHGMSVPTALYGPSVHVATVVEASAGDYFRVLAGHDAGGTLNTTPNADWTFLEVVLLGPQ